VLSFTNTNKTQKVAIIKAVEPSDSQFALKKDPQNSSIEKFVEFWELMDTVKRHGYLSSAMSVIGRSTVGAWWSLRRSNEYWSSARELQRKRLMRFYTGSRRTWDNIRDFQNMAGKLMISSMYLRFFGRAAFHILRDKDGAPIGMEFLYGLVVPNVDSKGKFKKPAFIQYLSENPKDKVEYPNPRDIVYIINPDWTGSPLGGSDIEALSTFVLPLDLYLLTSAREYLKNRDRPEVVYSLSSNTSDEGFDAFVKAMQARHAGPNNIGRSSIAVQGDFAVHELKPYPKDLPFQDSRKLTREEALAAAGVNGAKLGITENMTLANLREIRREFHETSLAPMLRQIELAFYEQIHVREFDVLGWEFKFNQPDFLTAVERATVHMRYYQMGVYTPNQLRWELGLDPREGDDGDLYYDQRKSDAADDGSEFNNQGSQPEGRPVEPDDPSQVGEPDTDVPDPVRGDQHDEQPKDAVLAELRLWRKFAVRRLERGRSQREFKTVAIPAPVRDVIFTHVKGAATKQELAQIFNDVEEILTDEA
jgi:hypothetical protein